jgi:PAS domain S-box-containing protein
VWATDLPPIARAEDGSLQLRYEVSHPFQTSAPPNRLMTAKRQLDLAANIRSQKLLERIPYLAWLMTDAGEIYAVNQRWCDYLGKCDLADANRVGSGADSWIFADLLAAEERDLFLDAWAAAKSSQEPLEIELRLQSESGEWEWFKVELESDGDRIDETIWIVTAIRLGGSAAILGRQQSTQFLEALLDRASEAIVACDADGKLVLFNRMAQVFHGLPPEPIAPAEWANYYDLYDRDGIRTLTKSEVPLFRALQGEAVVSQEMMIKSKQGGDRSLLASGAAIYSTTGEKLGAVALMRDITAYSQAMTALKQSERKFRAIFDGVFQFIGLTEPDGTLIEANLTALKFGGIESKDAIGRKFWEVPGWKFSPAVQQQMQSATAQAARGEFFRSRVLLSGAGDREIPIDFSLSPIRNDRGEVTMLIPEGRDLTQLEQAERYSERLSTALQVAKAGAWNWDLANQQIYWTREFEILFDYEPGSTEQVYSEWLDRIHPEDRERAEAALQGAIAGTLPEYRCEYRIVDRNGRIRWIDAIGEVQTDDLGNARMSGLIYDITERKRDESALRHSEEFTRKILESSQDCIKILDLEGRLLYMNNGGQELMEIDDFTAIDRQYWIELWQGDEVASADDTLITAKAGGVGRFEGCCATAKGALKWWEVVVTPILNPEGRVERILSISRDITERRHAALALTASEEMFRHTFEYTPVGFVHVALDGTFLRVNHKFCEIVGYSNDELLATTFQAITEPADLDGDLALVDRLLAGEINEYNLEKRYIHRQGHHVWVSLTVSLSRDLDADGNRMGAPRYFLGAIQDISERKRLELLNRQQTADLQHLNSSLVSTQQRLKERNEELDCFVYMASHDLKAPLRSIANLSEWIADDLNDQLPDDTQQQFQLLRQRVKRMDGLIDGLLRYSRIGRQDIETEIVDVAQLLAETIDSLAPPPTFQIEILSPLPTLNAKRILLSQVFANLLSNAIKHHDRTDGRIEIAAEDVGERYQFSIADDGPGIPEGEGRERMFEIFQTLQPSISSDNTGIGLALVKKIIEGEGGRIWLEDNPLGKGARFCFTWLKAVD